MKRVDREIEKLVTIANWAKSCKTLDQLENVNKFMNNHMRGIENFPRHQMSESHRVMYHCGIVDGIILSIRKLKFTMSVITPKYLKSIDYNVLNNLELRSDIENDNVLYKIRCV